MNKKAQGSYTLVHVTVKNVGTEAETMMADGPKAYDANGLLNLINFARVAGAVPAPTPVKP
mgnify:CR=1 FL=1